MKPDKYASLRELVEKFSKCGPFKWYHDDGNHDIECRDEHAYRHTVLDVSGAILASGIHDEEGKELTNPWNFYDIGDYLELVSPEKVTTLLADLDKCKKALEFYACKDWVGDEMEHAIREHSEINFDWFVKRARKALEGE